MSPINWKARRPCKAAATATQPTSFEKTLNITCAWCGHWRASHTAVATASGTVARHSCKMTACTCARFKYASNVCTTCGHHKANHYGSEPRSCGLDNCPCKAYTEEDAASVLREMDKFIALHCGRCKRVLTPSEKMLKPAAGPRCTACVHKDREEREAKKR